MPFAGVYTLALAHRDCGTKPASCCCCCQARVHRLLNAGSRFRDNIRGSCPGFCCCLCGLYVWHQVGRCRQQLSAVASLWYCDSATAAVASEGSNAKRWLQLAYCLLTMLDDLAAAADYERPIRSLACCCCCWDCCQPCCCLLLRAFTAFNAGVDALLSVQVLHDPASSWPSGAYSQCRLQYYQHLLLLQLLIKLRS